MKFRLRTIVMPLIAINIVVFILQRVLGRAFTNSFILISSDVFSRPWILLTSMFLHANVNHIFLNMYGLLLFGGLLEQRIGVKRFLGVYLASGFVAALLSTLVYDAALGASAAVMGVIGVLIILMPDLKLLLFFLIPMPLRVAGIVFAAIDLMYILTNSTIGGFAHLVGMGIGLAYGLYLKRQKRDFDKKFSTKKHLDGFDADEYLRSGRI